jgi:hypothetical protein
VEIKIFGFKINITKKIMCFIGIGILCIACYCAGRFIRFGRVSGTSQQLIDGIVLSRDTADKIINRLNITTAVLNSSTEYERAITRGIEELQHGNEVGGLCLSEIKRTVEDSKKFTEKLNDSYSEFSDKSEWAFDVAIRKSEEYERIISSLQQFADDIDENNQKSE